MNRWKLVASLAIITSLGIMGCHINTAHEFSISDDNVKCDYVPEISGSDDKAKYEYVPADDIDLQLNVIYENADIWQVSDEQVGDFCESRDFKNYGYAIADLDEDGYLEVIKSGWAGSGHYYTNSIYEVTESGNLEAFNLDAFRQLDSEPAMLAFDGFLKYRDDSGKLYYVMQDKLTDKGGPGDLSKCQVNFENNAAYVSRISHLKVDISGEVTYYDCDNNEIYMYEFYSYISEYYKDYNRERGQIEWFHKISMDALSSSYDAMVGFHITEFDRAELNNYIFDGALMGLMIDENCIEYDVTGDGYVDLCIGVTQGSGIVSSSIIVYDIYNQEFYELNDRGRFDYWIDEVGDDGIHIKQGGWQRMNNDDAITGVLRFSDGKLIFE